MRSWSWATKPDLRARQAWSGVRPRLVGPRSAAPSRSASLYFKPGQARLRSAAWLTATAGLYFEHLPRPATVRRRRAGPRVTGGL